MTKKIIAAILVVLCIVTCAPTLAFAETYGSAEAARNSVARVVMIGTRYYYDAKGKLLSQAENEVLGYGSCFAVGEKGKPVSYFVTNRHVISKDTEIVKYTIDGKDYYVMREPISCYIVMDDEANMHPADVVTDNAGGADLAILKLREPTNRREPIYLAPYKNDSKLSNTTVYSLGFPGSLEDMMGGEFSYVSGSANVVLRRGVLSHEVDNVKSGGSGNLLLTDVAITPGNSGGPLVNDKGEALGVCTYRSASDNSLNGAISVNDLIKVLKRCEVPYMTKIHPDATTIALIAVAAALVIAAIVLAIMKSKSAKKAASIFRLQGISGTFAGKRFTIDKDIRIGRDAMRNDLVYPPECKKVSGIHCVILLRDGELFVQDSGSRNGTFVNQQRVDSGATRKLIVGDTITLADSETFRIDVASK